MYPSTSVSANCLSAGLQVGEYRILDVIGEGGFGIVYRALDLALDREIALKEYMPSTLAGRRDTCRVHVRSQHKGAFDAGLRSFINEARLLARFSHPALVHVYRFFEENGTAYMVMHYYKGNTLAAALAKKDFLINQAWISGIMSPILDVLEVLHAADCYHRDISPDNIFLQQDNTPVLLDFGAARRIIGDMTQALTMVLKPGFAPIEQYVDDGAMPQGAWTDIYQLGALMHLMVTGHTPPTSVARMINDPLRLPTPAEAPGFTAEFLQAIGKALAVKPLDRPQTIRELRNALGLQNLSVRLGGGIPMADFTDVGQPIAALIPRSNDAPMTPKEQDTNPTTSSPQTVPQAVRATEQPSESTTPPEVTTKKASSTIQAPKDTVNGASAEPPAKKRSLAGIGLIGVLVVCVSIASAAWWNHNSRKETEARQAIQQENLAWEQARAASSIGGLQDYLRKFPDGLHRKEAQALLLELSQEALDAAQLASSATASVAASAPAASTQPSPMVPASSNAPPSIPAATVATAPASSAQTSSVSATRTAAPETLGKVVFRVMPWGYVSVNRGAAKASPPMTQVELPEGVHHIEISNPGVTQPIAQTVNVKRGETTVITQKFE